MANDVDEGVTDADFSQGYDFLLINSGIDAGLFLEVMNVVVKGKKNSKVVLIVITHGGLANEAYRVGRFLQSLYDEVVAFVPSLCKSAGTLLIAAANRVVMSAFGEIGPLDVQLIQKDELFGRRSGLTTRSALDDLKGHSFDLFEHFLLNIIQSSGFSVSFKLAAEISAKMASELMSSVYSQINPESLGQDFRDLSVATKYCEKLNRRSRNLKSNAIRRLVHEYPSHDFVIDAEEAMEIFERLMPPGPELWKLVESRMVDLINPRVGTHGLIELLTVDADMKGGDDAALNAREKSDDEAGADAPRRDERGQDAAQA